MLSEECKSMAARGFRSRTGEGGEAPFSEIYLALRELSCHKRRTVDLPLPEGHRQHMFGRPFFDVLVLLFREDQL
jgi:hypothetical protein